MKKSQKSGRMMGFSCYQKGKMKTGLTGRVMVLRLGEECPNIDMNISIYSHRKSQSSLMRGIRLHPHSLISIRLHLQISMPTRKPGALQQGCKRLESQLPCFWTFKGPALTKGKEFLASQSNNQSQQQSKFKGN